MDSPKIAALKPAEKIDAVKKQDDAVKNFNIGTSDQDRIKDKLTKKRQIEQGRIHHERQWLTNIAFLYGKQHFAIGKKPTGTTSSEERIHWEFKNIERNKKTITSSNYILPLWRSLMANMLLMKSFVNVDSTTAFSQDVEAAKIAKQLLGDFWDNCNKGNPMLSQQYAGMTQVLQKAFAYATVICQGTLHPYFNRNAMAKTFLNDEIIEGNIGAVEVDVLHNFEYYPDPLRQFAFTHKIQNVEDIWRRFDVEVEPEDIDLTEFERQLRALLEGTNEQKYFDACNIHQYFELPSRKQPNGLWMVMTDKEIIEEGDLPEEFNEQIPLFTINYLDIPLAPFPQSMIEQLIPGQEDYNFTIKRIRDYKKWMTGKVMLPDGAKLQSKWDDEVGQVVKHAAGAKPEYLAAPSIPQELFNDLMRIRRDMEDIAARHDVSMARTPSGVKSGVALNALVASDTSMVSPVLQHIESRLSSFSDFTLRIMEKKYNEPRVLSIAGQDLEGEVMAFSGDQASGNRSVKISIGSSMPATRDQRQAFILGLGDKQYITKDKALDLLEIADVDGVYSDIDKTAEKSEIQEMMKGALIEPMPYENHSTRLKILADFMMGDTYKKMMHSDDPEKVQIAHNIYEHYQAHQQMLMSEMSNQPGAPGAPGMPPGGGAPPPRPGMPGA